MMDDGIERRLFPRKLVRTKVVFEDEFGEGLIYLFSENISLGGIFLASDVPIKTGSYVFLSFYLPDTKTHIRATGQVVRVSRPDSAILDKKRDGIGIRFVGLSPEASQAIQGYIS